MSLADELQVMAEGFRWGRRPLPPEAAGAVAPARGPVKTAWARTAPARAARELVQRGLLKPVVWGQTRPRVEGLDRLARLGGPVVFVANHSSHLDAPLLLGALPPAIRRRTVTGAAADYFFASWWRSLATGLVFNAVAVERAGRSGTAGELRYLVAAGWNLLLFPEGTRSRDGAMKRFHQGAAQICIDARAPAVPVCLRGTFAAMPPGAAWPRKGRLPVAVRFGEPLVPGADETRRAFTGRLEREVAFLWDEDATTWWQSLHRRTHRGEVPGEDSAPAWRRRWEGLEPLSAARRQSAWPR